MAHPTFLYPRLSRRLFDELAGTVLNSEIEQLLLAEPERIERYSRLAAYRATGGTRVPESKISEVVAEVRGVVAHHGYPGAIDNRVEADADIAACLHRTMEIVPSDAASPSVWSYMACVVLPDVVVWRHGHGESGVSNARFDGGVRNAFGRLWWRAQSVQQPSPSEPYALLHAGLSEDNWVQLMERPGLYGFPPLARTIVQAHLSARHSTSRKQDVMRDACKRLSRLRPLISFELLGSGELRAVVDECFDQAVAAVAAEMANE